MLLIRAVTFERIALGVWACFVSGPAMPLPIIGALRHLTERAGGGSRNLGVRCLRVPWAARGGFLNGKALVRRVP